MKRSRKPSRPWEQRYWERVDRRGPDDCWPWTAGRTKDGYGRLCRNGRDTYVTHIALELDGRPRPPGRLEACHTCDNPPCCNPAHLWWGTTADNARDSSEKGRSAQLKKTHCPMGHALSGANLIIERSGKARRCRSCHNEQVRKYEAKKHSKDAA
jgi:hypothetical protein